MTTMGILLGQQFLELTRVTARDSHVSTPVNTDKISEVLASNYADEGNYIMTMPAGQGAHTRNSHFNTPVTLEEIS